jgi:epoxyqueuosine reductase
MKHAPSRRSEPQTSLPGAKSVIALAMPYSSESPASDARIARYTVGRDYHKVIEKRLYAFVRYVEALAPGVKCKIFVDAGPLLERPFAQRAGLGFIGKNTLLITKGLGSWVFLAHVVTTLELPPDAPDTRSCGSCTLCIQACPTDAIRAPFELDARRCISYLTIELEGDIPEDLRPGMGGWIFGCDICQEVCPHNKVIRKPKEDVSVRDDFMALEEILSLRTDDEFKQRFEGTSFTRTGRAGLVRNACVVAANLGRRDLLPVLEQLRKDDPDAVVRSHAAWAEHRLQSALPKNRDGCAT